MSAVDFRDNLLGISWVDSGWVPILNPGNVLDYFSERSNPFYDRTCNNEVVKMQRLTLDHLNQMVGVEYILLHAQEPILYIIRKQQRQSQTQVVPLADYYIIAGVVYQAPDLGTVISSRAFMESSQHLMRPCHIAATTHPKDTGGTSRIRKREPKPGEKPIPVEVKKEPEPPTETVKQEEREPATKSSAPAPPSKPPPEKRARLQ
ncbi:hypothetical protein INR49_013117 [Caranx melampygus]|nr:hypothetical protein INR49_013117 [Caranx melampygus]